MHVNATGFQVLVPVREPHVVFGDAQPLCSHNQPTTADKGDAAIADSEKAPEHLERERFEIAMG